MKGFIYIYESYWLIGFFFVMFLPDFGIRVILASKMGQEISLFCIPGEYG